MRIDSAELTVDNNELEKFYLYGHQDPVIDGNSPFYFNTTYGVLNLGTYTDQFIFLTDDRQEKADSLLKFLIR